MNTHAFTLSGLGQAPFAFAGVRENAIQHGDGTTQAGGTCAHCATGIRWEFAIVSADGVKSVVGSDCIRKVGDRGLIEIVKAEQLRRRREAAAVKRSAEIDARLQAQRDRNGGLTDWEVCEQETIARRAAEEAARQPVIDILEPLADLIHDDRGGFCDSIARDLARGFVPEGRARALVCEIIAKQTARRGSKAFEARQAEIDAILAEAEAAG